MLPSFTFFNPTRVLFGAGELSKLRSVVDEVAGPEAPLFLVTGRRSLDARGVRRRVIEALGGARVTPFDEVPPFPSPEVVERALSACRAARAEGVVAIGGGSALDVAKSVALLATHEGTAREFAARERTFERPGLPVVAAPTTSGSSSEVTPFAALWDLEGKRLMHLGSPLMYPKVAIVDPELTLGMPRDLAAVTGMDAFTSAFEAYWSLEAEPVSDALSLTVIRLFAENLERSCNEGDLAARSACALAATVSGIAYSQSRPNACHAVSTPLTLFWGTAHGQAVGITLPSFLRWVAPAIPAKLPALWRALGAADLDDAVARISGIMQRCGLETRLQGLGVGEGDVETLVTHMRWDRVGTLPRPLEPADARAMFTELLRPGRR